MLIINNESMLSTIKSVLPDTQLQGLVTPKRAVVSAKLGDPFSVDGEVMLRHLVFRNTNDGKHALTLNVGLFRMICTNGLAIPASIGGVSLKIIHKDIRSTQDFVANVGNIIQQAIEEGENCGDIIQDLKDIPLTESECISITGSLNLHPQIKRRVINLIVFPEKRRDLEQVLNVWTLYNLLNEGIRFMHGTTFKAYDLNQKLLEDVLLLAA